MGEREIGEVREMNWLAYRDLAYARRASRLAAPARAVRLIVGPIKA